MADVTLSMKEYEELQEHKKLAEHYKEAIDKLESGDSCIVKGKDRYEGTLITHTSLTIIPYSEEMAILTQSMAALQEHVGHMCAMRKSLASFEATISNAFIGKHSPKDFPGTPYDLKRQAYDTGWKAGKQNEQVQLAMMPRRKMVAYWKSLI